MDKEDILNSFPKLRTDANFCISSPYDENYNCIAWADLRNDRWMWPVSPPIMLDGVYHWWPAGSPVNDTIEDFKLAFSTLGYIHCESGEQELGYRKIAFYVTPDTQRCTHASRQLRNGIWASKLGKENDIEHSSPYSIEGVFYGEVSFFMKKELS